MSMFDDDLADGVQSLLDETGGDWTYSRGALSASITLNKSDQAPAIFDDGSGMVTEVLMVDFRGLLSGMGAFGLPQTNDLISNSTSKFKVLPKLNEKCYHTVGSMVHIYTKQVPK